MYDINASASLKEDMELIEPLNQSELDAEGLTQVYANGNQLHIIRAVPYVARQIAEANFGNIIGSKSCCKWCSTCTCKAFSTLKNLALTDRLRLNRALSEVPKGASFPQACGVFSRVAFSNNLPSVNNAASFKSLVYESSSLID